MGIGNITIVGLFSFIVCLLSENFKNSFVLNFVPTSQCVAVLFHL